MILALVREFTDAIVIWVILCIGVMATYRHVARRFGWHPWATLGMGVALAGMLALTLTPDGDDIIGCRLALPTRIGLLQLPRLTQMSLNTLMPLPLGFFGALAVRRPWMFIVVIVALPVAIEATQGLVLALGRSCTLQDVVDNVIGGLVGMIIGVALRMLLMCRAA